MATDPVDAALADNIKRASDDSGSFETQDIDKLIDADRYVRNRDATAANPFAQCKRARAIAAGPVQ